MSGYVRREEIMANWSKYKNDPFYLFASPLFKPSDDPRSSVQFASDNFFEVIQGRITEVFTVLLQPVFKIFQLMTNAVMEMTTSLFNVRALMANMWKKWNDVSEMFMRRFQSVFHNLRVTFTKLYSSMEKTFGVAASSIYAGLSTVSTVLSFVDLMIKVIIIIMVILVIMMIFLFFILFPVMPLILTAVAVLVIAGVGGIGESFCFTEETLVDTMSGPVPISKIKMGDALRGGTVEGILHFDTWVDDLYELMGVKVSGTHIVYDVDNKPIHVKDHPGAKPCEPAQRKLFCLITSHRRIPVHTEKGVVEFADWEEISEPEELLRWNKEVFETLNHATLQTIPSDSVLNSESAVSSNTQIATPIGPVKIRRIHPGDIILDVAGKQTRVLGVVRVSDVERAVRVGQSAYISCGAWILEKGVWKQPDLETTEVIEEDWYSLFTEAGTFQIVVEGVIGMRDFTDIGASNISQTYDWVLESVTKNPRL